MIGLINLASVVLIYIPGNNGDLSELIRFNIATSVVSLIVPLDLYVLNINSKLSTKSYYKYPTIFPFNTTGKYSLV